MLTLDAVLTGSMAPQLAATRLQNLGVLQSHGRPMQDAIMFSAKLQSPPQQVVCSARMKSVSAVLP